MIELRHRLQFFLGANSADGFSSLYDRWIDQEAVQAFYVIKGGAGCGKSTLMGRVAETMESEGYSVEYIRCSGTRTPWMASLFQTREWPWWMGPHPM